MLRLLATHPHFEVVLTTADSKAGGRVSDLYPNLAQAYPDAVLVPTDPSAAEGLDLVFLALPHGASQKLMIELRKRVGTVVDLAADFRLRDPAAYPIWYGEPHHHPDMLAEATFGLPELFRESLPGASLIAAAGCYVTAASLALAPLVRLGLIEREGVIVDAASGVSGSGSALKDASHFNRVDEDFTAYGLVTHRHTPEIEQVTGAQVIFTPHLAPMNRGILATCYARSAVPGLTNESVLDSLGSFYAGEPFVVVSERSPSTKATLGSNCAHLTARFDPRTGWVIAICALDNMTKGASGQAIQCANLALGIPEATGLPTAGLYP